LLHFGMPGWAAQNTPAINYILAADR